MFEETVVVGRHRQRVADAGDHLGSSFDDHLKERRFYRVLPSFFGWWPWQQPGIVRGSCAATGRSFV